MDMLKHSIFSISIEYFLVTYNVQELFLARGIQQTKTACPHEAYILIRDVLVAVLFYMAGPMAFSQSLGIIFFTFQIPLY